MAAKNDEWMGAVFGFLRAALDAAEKFDESIRAAQEGKVDWESMRPHGRWIIHWIAPDDEDDAYMCSECDGEVLRRSKYCPNCGARME